MGRRNQRRINNTSLWYDYQSEEKEEIKEMMPYFGQRITDPTVSDPMINWLMEELYDFGLQSQADTETVEILMESAKYWSCEEENVLVALWILLGKPIIQIVVDEEEINRFLPYVYEGFLKTMKMKLLSSSIVKITIEEVMKNNLVGE